MQNDKDCWGSHVQKLESVEVDRESNSEVIHWVIRYPVSSHGNGIYIHKSEVVCKKEYVTTMNYLLFYALLGCINTPSCHRAKKTHIFFAHEHTSHDSI